MNRRLEGLYIFFLLVFMMFCVNVHEGGSGGRDLRKEVVLTVEELHVKHYVRLREGCLWKRFVLVVGIKNLSDEKKVLRFGPPVDLCESEVDTPQIYWLVKGRRIALVPYYKEDSLIKLWPGDTARVYLRTINFRIFGLALKHIRDVYQCWFEDSFVVVYNNMDKKYIIRKSDSFRVKYFLDDTLVSPEDSFRFSLSYAPYLTF